MKDNKVIDIDQSADKVSHILKLPTCLPKTEETINIISALYENFERKNIGDRFTLERFEPYKTSFGLLVGIGKSIAVFWHSRAGHFWFPRELISFEHEAAFMSGTSAPIITTPEIGICYTFGRGSVATIARPRFDKQQLPAYLSLLAIPKISRTKSTSTAAEDSDDGTIAGIQFFAPSDFSIS